MKKGYLSILGLVTIFALLQSCRTDFRNRHRRNFFDMVNLNKTEIDQDDQEAFRKKKVEASMKAAQYVCTNGKNPDNLNNLDYMIEFVNGPCAPAILSPGIGASVLVVQIECEKLLLTDPDTFASCGWIECKQGSKLAPQKEYRIWQPAYDSPMSLNTPLNINKACWGGLVEPSFVNISGQMTPVQQKIGVKVLPMGMTPETYPRNVSLCGINGVQNLIPNIVNPPSSQYYAEIVNYLNAMGYKEGLTLIGLPYDFRQGQGFDDFSSTLNYVLNELNKLSGKRSIVFAHSMGNSRMLNALWKMSQSDKDRLIHAYVPLAPAYGGAVEPIKNLICGSASSISPDNIGIDFIRYKKTVGSFLSMYELCPIRAYSIDRYESWMKQILQRIAYENGTSANPGDIDFLPPRNQTCYPNFDAKQCRSGLYEYNNYGHVNGTAINNDNYRSLIDQYGFNSNLSSLWNLYEEKFETTIPNPGVQMNIVYTSVLDTEGGFEISGDPRNFTSKDQYCSTSSYKINSIAGDGSVPSTAAVTPGFKWAMEFKSGQQDAKAVKFIEICSYANQAKTPYDGKDKSGVNQVTKNGYIGIPCDCSQTKVRHCAHSSMLFLPELLDFIGNIMQINQSSTTVPSYVSNMTPQQLNDYVNSCKAYVYPAPSLNDDSPRAAVASS